MNFLRKLMPKILIVLAVFIIPIGIQLSPDNTVQITENITYAADCSFGDLGCYYVNLLELVLINVTQFFVGIAGFILDFFLKFTITSSSYRGSGFIEAGWEILRDFTNIVFIFSLLVISFKLVLGQDDGSVKKTLVKTILLALTINFSLFGVFAVMDTSNILAYTIYNKIEAPEVSFNARDGEINSTASGGTVPGDPNAGSTTNTQPNPSQTGSTLNDADFGTSKSLSLALVQKVNPQKLLKELKGDQDTARLILIFIVATINISFIFLFLSTALLMLGRTLGLMVLAVLSPLAVASMALGPKGAGIPYVGWNTWFPQLISLSFMAPVFLFFLYLTTLFSKITDNMQISGTAGIVETVFQVALPMLTIFALIQLAKKVSTKMAGEIGGVINSYVQKAAGAAIGVAAVAATGGAAAAGGALRLGGAAATALGNKTGNERLQKIGRASKSLGKTTMAFKADVTKIPGFNALAGKAGIKDLDKQIGRYTGVSGLDADLAVRAGTQTGLKGLNDLRTGISDTIAGRDTAAVAGYNEKLQESRDKNTKRRIENIQETGRYETYEYEKDEEGNIIKDADGKPKIAKGSDGKPIIAKTKAENAAEVKENRDKLEKAEESLAYQSTAEKKAEKERVEGEKAEKQKKINTEETNKSQANKEIGDLTKAIENHTDKTEELQNKAKEASQILVDLKNATTPKDKDKAIERELEIKNAQRNLDKAVKSVGEHTSGKGSKDNLKKNRDKAVENRDTAVAEIEKLKKEKEDIDKTTLEGQVKELKKDIDKQKNDARAWLLEKDNETQFTLQDSNLVMGDRTSRQERTRRQAARSVNGSIDTKPGVGGSSKKKK